MWEDIYWSTNQSNLYSYCEKSDRNCYFGWSTWLDLRLHRCVIIKGVYRAGLTCNIVIITSMLLESWHHWGSHTHWRHISNSGATLICQGAIATYRCRLASIGIPKLKIRRSRDRLIFNMRIPISGNGSLYIETGPWFSHIRKPHFQQKFFNNMLYIYHMNNSSLHMISG